MSLRNRCRWPGSNKMGIEGGNIALRSNSFPAHIRIPGQQKLSTNITN